MEHMLLLSLTHNRDAPTVSAQDVECSPHTLIDVSSRSKGVSMRALRRTSVVLLAAGVATLGLPVLGVASVAAAAQPAPGHNRLVPTTPRTDTPRIPDGEIWDIEVVGNRVFVAGTFTSIADVSGTTTPLPQRSLAAYDINTGRIDRNFRPTFNGGVNAVEASPDGTKLFVAGTFSTVNGVARQKVASLNLTTGAPLAAFNFAKSTNNQATALSATNSTVYVGGRFTRINGVVRSGLAAVNAVTGAVDTGFNLPLSGGVGTNGTLTVQQLKLTHDESKLLVVHTARQIAGQDRYGVGLIDTATKSLLPWRTRLWEDYLPFVGGIQRVYAGDIAPDDRYFVVGSGSGGDRPPINDTVIAFPIAGGDNTEPLWVSRHFDSVYSVAVTEVAVYVGGHFQWQESPTANQPWPGLDNVGYGTGQGLSGYGLGDQVVRRDHIGALDPATGTALEWNPGSNSFEGNKAMEATPRGLFVGGDGMVQGGKSVGRVAFYDFSRVTTSAVDTTITTPIEGRVVAAGEPFTIAGQAIAPGPIARVQVEIKQPKTQLYLQDDLTTWGKGNTILATVDATTKAWTLELTSGLAGTNAYQVLAKAFASNRTSNPTKAVKKIESFSFDDATPATSITAPSGVLTSTSFTMTGTATDDHGVNSLSYWFRNSNNEYLQDDGTVARVFNSFRGEPDVVGAPSATWRFDVTLPHEGEWRGSATATDTAGQPDLRSATRDWIISTTGTAPTVSISAPTAMTPPTPAPTLVIEPGRPLSFSGTANDDAGLRNVEITLRNSTTRENLAADGSWGTSVIADTYRVSPLDIQGTSYDWSYTTPFTLSPGAYTFTVRATDDTGLTTSAANRGSLAITAQVPGDAMPNGLLNVTGTSQDVDVLHLDLAGTATDDKGVQGVRVALRDSDTGRYVQPDGTMAAAFATVNATLATPGETSTTWSLPIDLPGPGSFGVEAWALDTAGQQDPSTTGATARYLVYPGDADPTLSDTLSQPTEGTAFAESRVVVSGRALDDVGLSSVQVAVVNGLGQYMSSTGSFTSTTESWRSAFLTSPGTPGSNYSYTTPAIPSGSYRVRVRAVDNHGQVQPVPRDVNVTVSAPPGNQAPVANATVSCDQNVCTFDGRGSTDESPSSLTYAWNFGNGRTGTGALPSYTYATPGTFTVSLTVRDQYAATGTTTQTVTIVEPTGNQSPTAVFNPPNCSGITCTMSGVGSSDPNIGDTLTYAWNFGDGTAIGTAAQVSHAYATAGTYTVTLTVTDGWGKAGTPVSRTVTVTSP